MLVALRVPARVKLDMEGGSAFWVAWRRQVAAYLNADYAKDDEDLEAWRDAVRRCDGRVNALLYCQWSREVTTGPVCRCGQRVGEIGLH